MKKFAFVVIAAASLAGSAAYAQGVSVGVPGVGGVTVGDPGYRDGYRRDREYRRSYNRYDEDRVIVRRDRDRDWDRRRGDRVYIERD